jgi:hypothetical protein
MMVLNYDEAVVANLALILLGKDHDPRVQLTQSALMEKLRPYNFSFERILGVLAKLDTWGLISRDPQPTHNLLFASDYRHNLQHSPNVSKMYQIEVFADITPQGVSPMQYEIMVCSHNHFNDWISWADGINKIHANWHYREIGARIIEIAVSLIADEIHRRGQLGEAIYVPAVWLVPQIQLAMFTDQPLISPLVVQAFVEHPFVKMCLREGERDLTNYQGRTEIAYKFVEVDKIPTREECREAVQA